MTSENHNVHEEAILPLAVGRLTCIWRQAAMDVLDQTNRDYRVIITGWSATVLAAAVLSGLAVSVLPECAIRPDMRVLGEAEGFAPLPEFEIDIIRGPTKQATVVDALAQHIVESLDNISAPDQALASRTTFPSQRIRRVRNNELLPDW